LTSPRLRIEHLMHDPAAGRASAGSGEHLMHDPAAETALVGRREHLMHGPARTAGASNI
jgi:hypothetical protein